MSRVLKYGRDNAVALLALLVATGGTSYAAVSLPKDSVTAKQIASGAVRSDEVKNASLKKADFAPGQLPTGPKGPQGPQGPVGPTGDTGPQGPAGRSALTTLQSGETVVGYANGDYEAAAAGGDWGMSASFPIPGATNPTAAYVDGFSTGETCSGTGTAPTAPPGTICVYPLTGGNPASNAAHNISVSNRFGFKVVWKPTAAGDTYFGFSYAFTQE